MIFLLLLVTCGLAAEAATTAGDAAARDPKGYFRFTLTYPKSVDQELVEKLGELILDTRPNGDADGAHPDFDKSSDFTIVYVAHFDALESLRSFAENASSDFGLPEVEPVIVPITRTEYQKVAE